MSNTEALRAALQAAREARDAIPLGAERSALNVALDRLDVALSAAAALAQQPAAGVEPVADLRERLTDAIAAGLQGTYHCTRVWSAWHVGTMSEDDFEPVDESNTPAEIAAAVLALMPTAPQPAPAPAALLVRDIASDIGVKPLIVCKALETLGYGPHSVNMAITADMARGLTRHFGAQPTPALVPPAEDPWRKLYRRAINEANGLTNYVEDRPELRSAERRLTAIEEEARTLAAAATPAQGVAS